MQAISTLLQPQSSRVAYVGLLLSQQGLLCSKDGRLVPSQPALEQSHMRFLRLLPSNLQLLLRLLLGLGSCLWRLWELHCICIAV